MIECPTCHKDIQERYCPWCGHDSYDEEMTPPRLITPALATRVYVVQNQYKNGAPKFDLSSAERFGKLDFLLASDARPSNADACIRQLHDKLRNIRRHDYLLLLGNPCLIGWTVAIASHYSGGSLNLLQWEKRADAYVVIQCDVMKTN
jgi:hypothetical protein